MSSRPVFLTAKWHNLFFANYVIQPTLVKNLVPRGTSLDNWNGRIFISLVAFQFLDTKILGVPAFSQRNFDEVNLRFYVNRTIEKVEKRGVVFIREIVPSRIIAWVANRLYGENYTARKMQSKMTRINGQVDRLEYRIMNEGRWNMISSTVSTQLDEFQDTDLAPFITEHYWGYSKRESNVTIEYEVEHPKWSVYQVENFNLDLDFESLYGPEYAFLSDNVPESIFYCPGSEVKVRLGSRVVSDV